MPDQPEIVEADTALGKFKISSANMNNLMTVLIFVAVVLGGWQLWAHAGDAKESGKAIAQELKEANKAVAQELKEANKEMTMILREMARATREQNCLLSVPQERRQAMAETCRRIAQ